jgi:hypothetical protein
MMGLFGNPIGARKPTLLSGIVATPEEEAQTRRLEELYGAPPPSVPMPQEQPPAQQQSQRWLDGGKFGTRDAIGLALGAIGDAFAQHNGGQAMALPMVTQGLMGSRKAAQERQKQLGILTALKAQGLTDEQAMLVLNNAGNIGDFREKPPEDDQFTRSMRAAGIDPASPQGQALYQQRVSTMASPAPNFLGDGLGGGRWVQPPSMPLPGAPSAQAQSNGPQPGTVEDGYQFQGGNPADPRSWKPMGGGAGNGVGTFRPFPR